MARNMFRLEDGTLDRGYLRVCATFKLLKLCRIDEGQAVELLTQRGIRAASTLVDNWVDHLSRNEWSPLEQRTVLGNPYTGPRPAF